MSDLHDSADQRRRDYIVGALKLQGAMYEGDARAYLAEHDTAQRAEVLRDFLWRLEQSAGDGVVENLLAHNPDLEQLTAATEKASTTVPPAPSVFRSATPEHDRLTLLRNAITRWQGEWATRRTLNLYRACRVGDGRHEQATADIEVLHAEGFLTRHTENGGTFYTLAPAGEKASTDPVPTATPDFFQPDHTYQRRRWHFQCLATAPNPFNGETRAVGYLYRPGEPATATALDPDDWTHGEWIDITKDGA